MATTKLPSVLLEATSGSFEQFVYQSRAEAIASSPGVNVTSFITLGYYAPGDGGAGIYVYDTSPETSEYITTANGRVYELEVDMVNPKMFGSRGLDGGPGTYDDNPMFAAMLAYSKIKKTPIDLVKGTYHFYTPIVIDFAAEIFGHGPLTVLAAHNFASGGLFNINLGLNGRIDFLRIGGFHCHARHSNANASTVAAFEFNGTGGNGGDVAGTYPSIGWSWFGDMVLCGFYAGFRQQMAARTTSHGAEGGLNWCHFENIRFLNFNRQCQVGFMFNTGSGTGNTYKAIGGRIDLFGFLFQGANYVVGDIVVEGGQWGSFNTAGMPTLFGIGDNTIYRSRIYVHGIQCDAGMRQVMQLSSVGATPYNWIDFDVVRGGDCVIGPHPAMTNSRIGPNLGAVAAG